MATMKAPIKYTIIPGIPNIQANINPIEKPIGRFCLPRILNQPPIILLLQDYRLQYVPIHVCNYHKIEYVLHSHDNISFEFYVLILICILDILYLA